MRRFIALLLATLLALAPGVTLAAARPHPPELFYHIFVRSFADSNGDRHGDLAGIRARLDYFQRLGVTTVLLTPLYPSPFYHNYFADDFEGIDGEFGSMADFRALTADLHRRGMKIFLDEEIQYVSGQHGWYRQSHNQPGGRYDGYLLYKDASNHQPVPTLTASTDYRVWPDQVQQIFTVNLAESKVRAYFTRYLKRWVDPNQDGDPRDGVDGFRIDHMMDDLDNRGVLTDLLHRFWAPMLDDLRALNPKLRIVAEQADWGDGAPHFTRGKVDMVFAFPIWNAAHDLNGKALAAAIERSSTLVTGKREQIVFVENHDTERFANGARDTPEIRRLGAAMTLLIGWTPSIYYGQELGMSGTRLKDAGSNADAADIPLRQAFRWVADPLAHGNAAWYRTIPSAYSAPDSNAPGDGVSVAEQDRDPGSLLNRYRALAALRSRYPALATGTSRVVAQHGDLVMIERVAGPQRALVLFNLSSTAQTATIAAPSTGMTRRFGSATLTPGVKSTEIAAAPYSATVWTSGR